MYPHHNPVQLAAMRIITTTLIILGIKYQIPSLASGRVLYPKEGDYLPLCYTIIIIIIIIHVQQPFE